MAGGGAASDAGNAASSVLVPVGRAQTGESGDEIDSAAVGDRGGEFFDIFGGSDQAQAVAEPADDGATDENAPLQRIFPLSADLPGDGAEKLLKGGDGLIAGVHEHEAAGPISIFGKPAGEAGLAEESGLLVAGDSGDGD